MQCNVFSACSLEDRIQQLRFGKSHISGDVEMIGQVYAIKEEGGVLQFLEMMIFLLSAPELSINNVSLVNL